MYTGENTSTHAPYVVLMHDPQYKKCPRTASRFGGLDFSRTVVRGATDR